VVVVVGRASAFDSPSSLTAAQGGDNSRLLRSSRYPQAVVSIIGLDVGRDTLEAGGAWVLRRLRLGFRDGRSACQVCEDGEEGYDGS
jgi:hypothetical protein